MPRTKIVCTIGPSCQGEQCLREMIRAGMRVARINFSHGSQGEHSEVIDRIRRVSDEEGVVVPIVGDLQGPKIRIGAVPGDGIELRSGDRVALVTDPSGGRPDIDRVVHLPHPEIAADLRPAQRLLLDDGRLEFVVDESSPEMVLCTVITGGKLRSNKGVSAPGAPLSIPALTEKDRRDAIFAVERMLDYLALSFVRTPGDVRALRSLLEEHDSKMPIIVKIEKPEALTHFSEILALADGAMIARGDLGVETPPEHVPFSQKKIIHECVQSAKPVITATQMLDSMIENPRPTRAEASDVANAILDGTTAVMLSGETAAGRYPVEAVRMMARIAAFAESNVMHEESLRRGKTFARDSAEAISEAAVEMALELGAKAIVASTFFGSSVRLIARYRPKTPIVAITPELATQRQMGLFWGVMPKLVPFYETTDELIKLAAKACVESGIAQSGDTIIITAGIPPSAGQRTNMVDIHRIP